MDRREFLTSALCGAAAVCLPQVAGAEVREGGFAEALALELPGGARLSLHPNAREVWWRRPDGEVAWTFGGEAVPSSNDLNYPVAVAWDENTERVYVVDRGWGCVWVLSSLGEPLGSWGRGVLQAPRSVVVTKGGQVLVSDAATREVHRFSREGRSLTPFGQDELYGPGALALDRLGTLHVADHGRRCMHRYAPETGRHLGSYAQGVSPSSVAVDAAGLVWVADVAQGQLLGYQSRGAQVAREALKPGVPVALSCGARGPRYVELWS